MKHHEISQKKQLKTVNHIAFFSILLLLYLFHNQAKSQSNFEKINGFEPHFVAPPEAKIMNLKTDFGARGDGVTDDTPAFKKWLASKERTLFIPEGTYLLREQIRLEDGMKKTTIFGERRSKTIIKLADNAPGFADKAQPKVFIHMRAPKQHGEQNMFNYIYHLTIEIGKGNPGATALNFHTNNTGQVKDVTVRATDPINHKGFRGIAFDDYWFGPGGARYIEVEGFEEGIFLGNAHNQVTLEHVDIKNCKTGLLNKGNSCSLRKFNTVKCEQGIQNLGDGLMVLKDAQLLNGKGGIALSTEGKLLVINLQTSGYAKTISSNAGGTVTTRKVNHYTSTPVVHNWIPSDDNNKTLGLKVEESPEYQYPRSVSEWAVITSSGDITTSLQQAIDRGATNIMLRGGEITGTVYLRNKLQRIMGAGGNQAVQFKTGNQPGFKLEDGSAPAVIIELIYSGYGSKNTVPICMQASKRSFVLRHGCMSYNVAPAGYGGKVFMESIVSYPFEFTNVNAWLRDINTEKGGNNVPNILNNNSKLWILGMKVEDYAIKIKTMNGGFTELLGGVFRQNWDDEDGVDDLIENNPLFLVENASATFSFHTFNSPNAPAYKYLVREIRGKQTKNLVHTAHGGCCGGNQSLYVGYEAKEAGKSKRK